MFIIWSSSALMCMLFATRINPKKIIFGSFEQHPRKCSAHRLYNNAIRCCGLCRGLQMGVELFLNIRNHLQTSTVEVNLKGGWLQYQGNISTYIILINVLVVLSQNCNLFYKSNIV